MSTNFYFRLIKYSLKTQSDFLRNFGNSTKYCLNSIRFASNVWFEDFKNKIRRWEPDGCDYKFCKDFRSNLGYVNFGVTVRYWFDWTVRMHKFGLISSARNCLPCQHLSAWSQHGETATGCEICTGLAMMTTKQFQWCHFNFERVCVCMCIRKKTFTCCE